MTYHFRSRTCETGTVLDVSGEEAHLEHTGLQVIALAAGEERPLDLMGREIAAIPLSGAFEITVDDAVIRLAGRTDPVTELTDFAYVPPGRRTVVASRDGGRIAIASAAAHSGPEPRRVPREDVGVSIRGAGATSRQINALVGEGAADSSSLIVGEILTPGGGWSSYPAHKHDELTEDESVLEEIYYFEISDGDGPEGGGFAYQRVFSADDRELDLLIEARTGDALAIPHGWHGPVAVAPGCDAYNLYIMAGPGGRAWNITDHPEQAWIRGTWDDEDPDPRLPLAR